MQIFKTYNQFLLQVKNEERKKIMLLKKNPRTLQRVFQYTHREMNSKSCCVKPTFGSYSHSSDRSGI